MLTPYHFQDLAHAEHFYVTHTKFYYQATCNHLHNLKHLVTVISSFSDGYMADRISDGADELCRSWQQCLHLLELLKLVREMQGKSSACGCTDDRTKTCELCQLIGRTDLSMPRVV